MRVKTLMAVSVLLSPVLFVASTKSDTQVNTGWSPAFEQAFFDASRIYGKAGCGDVGLAKGTARAAQRVNLPANLLAAQIAVESTCNPLAVSRMGAIGLTQIMPSIWAKKYNNFRDINLLNPEQSLHVGPEILADSIKRYGVRDGMRRYNGTGPDAEAYATRVLTLAGMK